MPIITFLLEKGADPNEDHPHGECTEMSASQSSLEIVKLWLKYGARVNESWAMHAAVRTGGLIVWRL